MKICGIEFVPLNEPLESRLQTLATAAWFSTCFIFTPLFFSCFVYLLFTPFWWLSLLYLCWIVFDQHICEKSGRPSSWVQNWAWWRYMQNYFPADLKLVPGFDLDPHQNYLFCCYPHGILPAGPFNTIALESTKFRKIYPSFKVRIITLNSTLYMPIVRDLFLALGHASCSLRSLQHILSKPEGGYIAILYPGGAAEVAFAKPGKYTFIVKKRKGFVKVALKTGASLVPVVTFGETNLFDQIQISAIKKIQQFIKKMLGFFPVLLIGRGFLQYSFGIIPRKHPLTTVVGMPIEVAKTESPTDDQINTLHERFEEELINLFNRYKDKYMNNTENKTLEIL